MERNCNDFIIRDGLLVRDFEGMYQAIEDPWRQNELAKTDLFNSHALFHLGQVFPNISRVKGEASVMDAGCGFGNFAGILRSIAYQGRYVGVDISSTAIKKARSQCDVELCSFEVNDLSKYSKNFSNKFDLIYSSQTLYYLGPEIDQVIKNLLDYLKDAGVFCFVYNQTVDSFSNKWLIYELLKKKLLIAGLLEHSFFKIVSFEGEDGKREQDCAIGIYQKNDYLVDYEY